MSGMSGDEEEQPASRSAGSSVFCHGERAWGSAYIAG